MSIWDKIIGFIFKNGKVSCNLSEEPETSISSNNHDCDKSNKQVNASHDGSVVSLQNKTSSVNEDEFISHRVERLNKSVVLRGQSVIVIHGDRKYIAYTYYPKRVSKIHFGERFLAEPMMEVDKLRSQLNRHVWQVRTVDVPLGLNGKVFGIVKHPGLADFVRSAQRHGYRVQVEAMFANWYDYDKQCPEITAFIPSYEDLWWATDYLNLFGRLPFGRKAGEMLYCSNWKDTVVAELVDGDIVRLPYVAHGAYLTKEKRDFLEKNYSLGDTIPVTVEIDDTKPTAMLRVVFPEGDKYRIHKKWYELYHPYIKFPFETVATVFGRTIDIRFPDSTWLEFRKENPATFGLIKASHVDQADNSEECVSSTDVS